MPGRQRSRWSAIRPARASRSPHVADVAIEDHLKRFRDELAEQQKTDKIHLLFNNAGIGGGGSLFTNTREQWERTFNICWGGVYLGVRTFLPMLVAADEAHIVNTASVNGFWASIGMIIPARLPCISSFPRRSAPRCCRSIC